MDKEEIIDAYIDYLKNICTMSDNSLREIINRVIEKDPEQLNIIERLLFKTEKINQTTLTFLQSKKFKEEFDIKLVGTEINIYIENGCLSTDELKKLTQCIREIEQNDTSRLIKIWMDTPEKTIKEMEDILGSVEPGFPHKMVIKGPRLHEGDDFIDE